MSFEFIGDIIHYSIVIRAAKFVYYIVVGKECHDNFDASLMGFPMC